MTGHCNCGECHQANYVYSECGPHCTAAEMDKVTERVMDTISASDSVRVVDIPHNGLDTGQTAG